MTKEILRIISIWIVILPFVAGFINYKGLNRDSRWIFFLVIAALVPQVLTFAINRQNQLLNSSYNIYSLLEFIILGIIFSNKYQYTSSKVAFFSGCFLYAVIALALILKNGFANKFLNNLVCYNNIIYTIWILFLLKEQYHVKNTAIEKQNPFAWYLLALLIYAPCTIIVFAMYYYIRSKHNPVLMNLWIIQSICNIILYAFFCTGLFISGKKARF